MLKTFSLQGRLGRLRYFLFNVAVIAIAAVAVYALTRILTLVGTRHAIFSIVPGLVVLTYVLAIIASLCLMVRRLHDFDQSGWWSLSVLLLYLVQGHYETVDSLIGAILMGMLLLVVHLAIILTPGSKNANRFGEVPGSA